MFENYPDVVRISDLKEMLGIGRTKAYRLIKDGIIPSRKIGGNYYIKKAAIISLLENL